jgi:serine/threonine protein kinase
MYKVSVHPYVVRLLDYFEDREYIYLCLEKHHGTFLDNYIEVNGDKIQESDIITYASTIGNTLEYLHDNGILLRNIETSSIIMTDMTMKSAVPRISSFEHA